jgi:hypothetical protein
MTTSNTNVRAHLLSCAAEIKAHGGKMTKLVAPLVALNVGKADLVGGGAYYADLLDATAQAYLTPAQYKVFADTSLATRTKGELTPRGELKAAMSSKVAKVRAGILAAMALPKEKRGKVEKGTPTAVFFAAIDGYVERFAKPDASDKFDFDPVFARAALVALLKQLR